MIATAASDNKITKSEAENMRARWEELKSVTESFVHCCEQGNFGLLKSKHQSAAATGSRSPGEARAGGERERKVVNGC